MSRCPEYQDFLDEYYLAPSPKDTAETIATEQEIGWLKKEQTSRALRNARNGIATPVELHWLFAHNIPFPWRSKEHTEALLKGEAFPVCLRQEGNQD